MSMPYLGPEDPTPAAVEPSRARPADEPSPRRRRRPSRRSRAGDRARRSRVEPELRARARPPAPRTGWTLVSLIPHDGKEPPAGLADEPGPGRLVRRLGPLASLAPRPRGGAARGSSRSRRPRSPAPREIRVVAVGDARSAPLRLPHPGRGRRRHRASSRGRTAPPLIRQIQERLGAVGHARDLGRRGDDRRRRRLPGAGHDPLDAPRPGHRDGACRRDQPRGPDPRGPRRGRRLAELRPADGRQPPAGRLRGADPGPRAVLPGRRLPGRPLPARPGDAGRRAGRTARTLTWPSRSWPRPRRSRTRPSATRSGWSRSARRSPRAGSTSPAGPTPRPKTWSCRSSRSSGSSARGARSTASTSTSGTSRPSPGAGSGSTRSSRRSPSGSASGSRSTSASTPAGSRSGPRPSGSGRARTAPAWRRCSARRWPADRPSQGLMVPWRLAATMRNDHVATLPLVHWPAPVASLVSRPSPGRRRYSPVLARWVTLNDYFHLTDRPYETVPARARLVRLALPGPGRGPARSASRSRDWRGTTGCAPGSRPSSSPGRWRGRSRPPSPEPPRPLETDGRARTRRTVEASIETGRHDEAAAALDALEPFWAERLARGILAGRRQRPRRTARPGYLVLNPLGVPRRVAVLLPDAALDLRPEGPLRAAQFTDEGVCAVVDLPAFGFAWVPARAEPRAAAVHARRALGPRPHAQERVDRGRDRRGHGRNPRRDGRRRVDGPARPAARR